MKSIISTSPLFFMFCSSFTAFSQSTNDSISPIAKCQENIIVPLNQDGTVEIHAIALDNGSFGNESELTYHINGLLIDVFNCTDIGYQTATLEVIDGLGNTNTCTSTIEIVDHFPPLVKARNVDVYLEEGEITTLFAYNIDNGSIDNCGIASTTFSNGSKSINYTCADAGSHEVTIIVADIYGNIDSATAIVDIICIPNTYHTNDLANQILITPNPMYHQATVTTNQHSHTNVELPTFDEVDKKRAVAYECSGNRIEFSRESSDKGIYIYKISGDNDVIHLDKQEFE